MSYIFQWRVPNEAVERAEALLAELAPWGWEELAEPSGTVLRVHVQDRKQARHLKERVIRSWSQAEIRIDKEEDTDWQTAWQAFFQPVDVAGLFRILPPWEAEAEVKDRIPLVVHPKMAFGTGHHATTKLCLQAMAMIQEKGLWPRGQTILDVGTGSGILAVAAAKLGARCVAFDLDPVAMDNARENVQANQVEHQVQLFCGDIPSLRSSVRYPLVVANILAGPLIHMAADLAAHIQPGGMLILSGVLTSQVESVQQAYQVQGLGQPEIVHQKEWAALIWSGRG